VKVLDFGLAKFVEPAAAGHGTAAPTQTVEPTGPGLVMGTAAYMSPEQARGRPVDKRTDIWAFGCVLFEMLTGRPVFERETITDTLAAVVDAEPEWSRLPTATPAALFSLLRYR